MHPATQLTTGEDLSLSPERTEWKQLGMECRARRIMLGRDRHAMARLLGLTVHQLRDMEDGEWNPAKLVERMTEYERGGL